MTPRTSRISPHTESPHTILDHLAALTSSRISNGRLRIPCPAHGGTNPNLALWVNDGIAARCHSAGCSYRDIALAIEDRYGISIGRGKRNKEQTSSQWPPRSPMPGEQADVNPGQPPMISGSHALRLWHRSVLIPKFP